VHFAGATDKSSKLESLHIAVLITLFLYNLDIFRRLCTY
jgi:hypothetical protein